LDALFQTDKLSGTGTLTKFITRDNLNHEEGFTVEQRIHFPEKQLIRSIAVTVRIPVLSPRALLGTQVLVRIHQRQFQSLIAYLS